MASRKAKKQGGKAPGPGDSQQQQPENSISPANLPVLSPEAASAQTRDRGAAPAGAQEEQVNSTQGAARERIPERSANRPPNSPSPERRIDTSSVPDDVRERYVRLGKKMYMPNGELGFEDQGIRLVTTSEDRQVLRDMFDTSSARQYWGSDTIEVAGSENFRRTMWEYATRAGVQVKGYEPTKLEEAALVQSMARRASADREGTGGGGSQNDRRSEERAEQSEPAPTPGRPTADRPARSAQAQGRVVRGKLEDFGADHFNFDPHEEMSYFVKIKTPNGKVETLWGLDLERALQQAKSRPKKDDEIVARQTGREPVTVTKVERDGTERPLSTHKNRWEVETTAFTDEREKMAEVVRNSKISAQRAVEMYPALAGTYGALREAELYAKQEYTDPKLRQRWQQMVREGMANDIARGEPLVTTRVRADINRDRAHAPGPGSPPSPEYAPA